CVATAALAPAAENPPVRSVRISDRIRPRIFSFDVCTEGENGMRRSISGVVIIAALIVAVSGAVALGQDKKGAAKEKTLYDRLGGKGAITKVVDEFVSNCAADTKINAFFAKTAADPARLKKFKANLVDQICEASGGPCKYKGKDMKTAHAGMGIADKDFGALVEDLTAALDKFNVGAAEKNDLLGALGPMKKDIVTK